MTEREENSPEDGEPSSLQPVLQGRGRGFTFLLILFLIVALIGFVYQSLMVSLALSLFFTYLLAPLVRSLESRTHLGRMSSASLVLAALLAFLTVIVALLLPVIYREQGLSLDMWWVFTIPMIPTWLRPLWAPFVDRTGSRSFGMRRSWFIPCTSMGALAYMGMTLFEPTVENLVVVIALWTLKNSIMTTQDVAIDGYMVENIHDEERPIAAGVLDIARNIGMFVSWVGIAWLYDAYGWTIAMLVASLLLIACSLPGILRPEPPRPAQYERAPPPSLKSLLQRRESYYVYPLCFFVAMAGAIIATMYPTYLSDLGFRAAEVATMVVRHAKAPSFRRSRESQSPKERSEPLQRI